MFLKWRQYHTFDSAYLNKTTMLGIVIGSGANVFIIIVAIIIGVITGISVTDVLKTEEKKPKE